MRRFSTADDLCGLIFDRRQMLLGLGAVGAAALLPGCSNGNPKGPSKAANGGQKPPNWQSFSALRELVRTSPDHLAASASVIIASRVFARAVRFVRDNVAVLPPREAAESALSAVRWGPDAALRAGAGTLRERADLLAAMLTAMGASAKVVYCTTPDGIDAGTLYATRTPAFSVDYDALDVSLELREKLKVTRTAPAEQHAGPSMAAILALLPEGEARAAQAFDGVPSLVPIVEYVAMGATKWALALGGIDELTQAPAGLSSTGLEPATYPKVSIRLLAALSGLPSVPDSGGMAELAAGSWTVDQLAGSRVFISTGSASPELTADLPIDAVGVRSAAISVQQSSALTLNDAAIWTPKRAGPAPSVIGSPFTLSGARYQTPASVGGAVTGPFGRLIELDAAAHEAALASVQSLVLASDGTAFPEVQLNITALDANGAPVFGLQQSDFSVLDDSVPQAPVLLANAAAPVRMMLAYDCSGSITWPKPGDKAAFDSALAEAMVTSAASVPFQLGVADVGTDPRVYAAPDTTLIQEAIAACGSSSDLWTTLGAIAPNAGITAVILVSDFEATDDPAAIPALREKLAASGLAVALVPVSPSANQATVGAIVEACGAVVLDWTAPDFQKRVTAFVTDAATRASAIGYRSTYRLPDDQQANQESRKARVTLATRGSVSSSASYRVPNSKARALTGVAGLYLEMRVGVAPAVTRRLAGMAPSEQGDVAGATRADYEATRALLNGVITVAFEPGSPTPALSIDELLTSALSLQPLAELVGEPLSATLNAGADTRLYSASLSALFEPLQAKASTVTAPRDLRVAIMTEALEAHGLARRFDVVPDLNLTVAAEADAEQAFAATMRETMLLSFREGQVLASSAATALADATLQYLAPLADASTLAGFGKADQLDWAGVFQQYRAWHKFIPRSPAVGAMWVVDPSTGTTVAVYRDGMGGGCGKAAANAAVQTALFICSAYASYKSFVCKQASGVASYQCLGSFVGGVAAGVSGILAAAVLDEVSFADLFVLFMALIAVPFDGFVGVLVTVGAFEVYGLETVSSLYEHC